MAENEVLVDIRDLGKREQEVRLFDPYCKDGEKTRYTIIRLVKMSPGESKDCFQVSRDAYQKELQITQDDEKANKTFETVVAGMSAQEVIDTLIQYRRVNMEAASDLITIPDEENLSEQEVEAKRKEKIDE